MGKRGPKPKSDRQRQLQAGRTPVAAPRVKPTVAVCPDWLGEAARQKWSETLAELRRLGRLEAASADMIVAYAVAWVELQQATAAIEAKGRVLQAASGYLYPHPAVGQQRSALATLLRLSQALGLDPSSVDRMPPQVQPMTREEEISRNPKSRFFSY